MIYVTSDLHGCRVEEVQALLDRAGFAESDFLFVLGDVIDRGNHGAELLLWLTQMPNAQLILGNHEALMLACRFVFDKVTESSLEGLRSESLMLLENWIDNGGKPTMDGLRQILRRDPMLVEGILEYLEDAPLYEWVEAGGKDYLLVHAGLEHFRPDRPLEDYHPEELMFTRPGLQDRYFDDATVVFGHTPTEFFGLENRGRAVRTDSWICIDTGAAFGGSPMLLRLGDEAAFY